MNIDVTEKPTEINFLLKAVTVQVEKVVVIFVEFPDLHHQAIHDEAYYKKILFSNELGVSSLRNYYYEISKGRIDIQLGKFVGWFVDRNHNMKNIEDSVRSDIADFAIHSAIGKVDFKKFDNIQNYDRVPKSDGRVDHIIIIHAGEPQSITAQKTDMNPVCMFNTEYLGEDIKTTQQVFISESAPIGNFVHEFFHDMGDRSVQDLYTGGNPPLSTVGQWEIMSVGMYNPLISLKTPYAENIGFLPSYPMPWTMGRWYHGSLKEAIGKHASVAKGQKKEFTIYPFETNSNNLKVVSVMLDETRAISVIVRQNLGFDRGLRGKGVIISKIDASLAGSMNLLGPVRIQDAHPKSPVPPYLHFTYEYELDDAAFDIGPGQNSHYESEGVRIDLKEANKDGSYRVEFEVL
jgi:M6 family metalloprotease-like protein